MKLPLVKKDFTVAISLTGRFLESKPLCLYAVDHRETSKSKLSFCTLAWPPATLEFTPALSAEFLLYGLKKLSPELAANPSRANFFVGGPLTISKGLVREAERQFPDLDLYNHFVGSQLPYLTATNRIGESQKLSRERMRSCLEWFHGLLWQRDWLENPELDSWRREFSLVDRGDIARNLFEVHLGEKAERYFQNAKPGRKPQSAGRNKKLCSRLLGAHGIEVLPEDLSGNDPDLVDRGLMLLLAGLEAQSAQLAVNWTFYGEPAANGDLIWREGEVIGLNFSKPKNAFEPKWVCCLDKFNLQAVVREKLLPIGDLWHPGKGQALAERTLPSRFWSEVKAGDPIILVHHTSWKSAKRSPEKVVRCCFVKVVKELKRVTGKKRKQFVFPRYVGKGEAGLSRGFEVEFLEFSDGVSLAFPNRLRKHGPLLPFEGFGALCENKEKQKRARLRKRSSSPGKKAGE